jgi:3-oxoacyl-[acyl-carrier-protein] synthase II
MKPRIAITGTGAVTPLGVGPEALIDRWSAGESGIVDGLGRCADFEPEDHLTRKQARRADRFSQFALVACDQAIAQAGIVANEPYSFDDVGCVVGTGIGGIGTIENQHAILEDRGAAAVSPLGVPLMMANAAAGVVAMTHGLRGQCYGVVSACAAGANAIGSGLRAVQHGDLEACVVGGTESAITPLSVAAFANMGATSKLGISRPFDSRRDGFVMGEGAGAMVLEREDAARQRGAEILGFVTGYGATADAHHITAPEPNGDGAARAIRLALRDAEMEPGEVAYVNAHGTSTPLNDRAETQALRRALGEAAETVPISSTKSAIGHLLGAAGAVEAVATVMAMRRAIAPPTLNLTEPDPELGLDYVPLEARALERNGRPLAAISTSFGFGGHNAVLCLEAPE